MKDIQGKTFMTRVADVDLYLATSMICYSNVNSSGAKVCAFCALGLALFCWFMSLVFDIVKIKGGKNE